MFKKIKWYLNRFRELQWFVTISRQGLWGEHIDLMFKDWEKEKFKEK